ncbi:UDP-glucose dehydrogenase family protein [Aquipuribacter sp. MA13-6]|uniref:UDP-glucose dehydrogenase family protein n=1 Tax=unclassified Aquipuribacter TaxID=2635084 RepID=UPI003EEA32FB
MRVSIVGTGYVGLVSGAGLADVGHHVVCVDLDPAKVDLINAGVPPIFEDGLEEQLGRVVGTSLSATTDLRAAVLGSELTLIAVGTPFDGRRIDLTYVREAARQIGEVLRDKDEYHVVVVKSTVVPGTTVDVVLPTLEQASGKRAGEDFGVGMNPEFLAEGVAVVDFTRPDRIVLGGVDDRSRAALAELFAPFPDATLVPTDPTTAEMIKYTANSLLATMISFSNEIGNLCASVGVDSVEAMAGVHLDKRLSPMQADGSRVRPGFLSFLAAGCGFGGSCFPKDVKALVAFGQQHGHEMPVLDAVLQTNARQPDKMLGLLRRHVPDLAGARVTVLGMAFKPGTDDVRESPSLPVTQALVDSGAVVRAFDPIARETAQRVVSPQVTFTDTLAEALDGADAVLLMTRWPQFEQVPALLAEAGQTPVVVDGRRLLAKDSVPRYEGIGL